MTGLDYRLAVLTHGPDSDRLVHQALASFREHVTPEPEAVTIYRDPGLGFCGATAALWAEMVSCGNEYVAWLEHDLLVTRPVNLRALAATLRENPNLAQVALMRNACNDVERAAGGLFESRPGEYEPRLLVGMNGVWQEHRSYFTTNVSLMRRDFMEANPFLDDGKPFCEGRYGIALLERGYSFGVWGDGSPDTRHVGVRDGSGHGY